MSAESAPAEDRERIRPACGRNQREYTTVDRDSTALDYFGLCGHCFDGETLDDLNEDVRLCRSRSDGSSKIHKRLADVDEVLTAESSASAGGDQALYYQLSDPDVTDVSDLDLNGGDA